MGWGERYAEGRHACGRSPLTTLLRYYTNLLQIHTKFTDKTIPLVFNELPHTPPPATSRSVGTLVAGRWPLRLLIVGAALAADHCGGWCVMVAAPAARMSETSKAASAPG